MIEHGDSSLSRLLDDCWNRLRLGAATPSDAWHTLVAGTVDPGGPELRTVVLRACEPESRQLLFHTDRRSAKARQLAANPAVSLLFWDPQERVQLRCSGRVALHRNDALSRAQWAHLPDRSRALFRQSEHPGEPLAASGPGANAPDQDETEILDRFLVVSCTIDQLDWLRLDRDGHHRAAWAWRDGAWRGTWVAP